MARRIRGPAFLLLGVLLGFLFLELGLRMLPTVGGFRNQAVDAANPVPRFQPNREYTYSYGGDFQFARTGRLNNYGFPSAVDYVRRPNVVAVIGNSFAEAFQLPESQPMHARLHAALNPRGASYLLAKSGAALSDFLGFAAFARQEFAPSAYVVVVTESAVRESLAAKPVGGYVFRPDAAGKLRLQRQDYRPGRLAEWIKDHSALARYLTANLRLSPVGLLPRRAAPPTSAGDREAIPVSPREVVEAFLTQFPEQAGVPPEAIVLLLDADRPSIYRTASQGGPSDNPEFRQWRGDLIDRAARLGYRIVDLEPVFSAHYRLHRRRFDFSPIDSHWNGLGNRLAAQAVYPRLAEILGFDDRDKHARFAGRSAAMPSATP